MNKNSESKIKTAIDFLKESNLFKEKQPEDHFTESALEFENLTDAEILKYSVLFPWYINLKLGHEHYQEAITETKDINNKEEILKKDKILSEKTKTTHYTYFKNNLYYIQRVD